MPNNDFSGIPSLGDDAGLAQYMQQQQLADAGLGGAPAPASQQPQAQTQQGQQAQQAPAEQPGQQAQAPQAPRTYTREELAGILAQVDAIRQQGQRQAPQQQPQAAPQAQRQQGPMYSQQEMQFIQTALQQGYSMQAIQSAIAQRRAQSGYNPQVDALTRRMDELQRYLATQEYREAEAAFVERLTEFGDRFGLSEQDLVTFGNAAMQKGINIAVGNVDLETVFRAVFPEQYAIRVQRISQAPSSQIFGGSSAAEPTGAQGQKAAAEYAKAFLLKTMPNYPRK